MRAVSRCRIGAFLLALAALWSASNASAQSDPPSRIARLSYLDGAVSLRPAGLADWSAAPLNQPLTSGDQLWSDPGARLEMDLGSAVVRADENSSLSLLSLADEVVQWQLNAGSIDIVVRALDADEILEVDTPNVAVGLLRAGEYRISVDAAGTATIAVRNGQAQATLSVGGEMNLGTGQRGLFGANGSYAIVPATPPDEFDQWCQQREADWSDAGSSTQYVSSDAIGYQDLAQYGNWQPEPDYGEVWFPSQTDDDWAPYGEGHWAWVSPWGWSWVDQARWGFAPYHYGRWAFIGGHWGWVPPSPHGHALYAPALVAWVGGPGAGAALSLGGGAAVGWLPLARGEVYLPAFPVSAHYLQQVNLSNSRGLSAATIESVAQNPAVQLRYANAAAPRALSVVPQTVFTAGEAVRHSRMAVPSSLQSATPSPRVPGIAPERESVSGPVSLSRVARPPAALRYRAVIERHRPPPAPPAFELQQSAIRANGGLPVSQAQLLQLHATEPPRYVPPAVSVAAPKSTAGGGGSTNGGGSNGYRGIPERSAQFQPPSQLQHREPLIEPARAPATPTVEVPRPLQSRPPAPLTPPPPPPPQPKPSRRAPEETETRTR
jgi:hypothetical protein